MAGRGLPSGRAGVPGRSVSRGPWAGRCSSLQGTPAAPFRACRSCARLLRGPSLSGPSGRAARGRAPRGTTGREARAPPGGAGVAGHPLVHHDRQAPELADDDREREGETGGQLRGALRLLLRAGARTRPGVPHPGVAVAAGGPDLRVALVQGAVQARLDTARGVRGGRGGSAGPGASGSRGRRSRSCPLAPLRHPCARTRTRTGACSRTRACSRPRPRTRAVGGAPGQPRRVARSGRSWPSSRQRPSRALSPERAVPTARRCRRPPPRGAPWGVPGAAGRP